MIFIALSFLLNGSFNSADMRNEITQGRAAGIQNFEFSLVHSTLWPFSGRILMLLSFPVFFKFEFLLLSFYSLLFVPILFENNH